MADLVSELTNVLGDILTGKTLREKIAERIGVDANEAVITFANGSAAYSAATGTITKSLVDIILGWDLVVSTCAELSKAEEDFNEIMKKPGAKDALKDILGLK